MTPGSQVRDWTVPARITEVVRRRWEDGSLLRALAAGDPFPRIEVSLRGPRPGEIADDLDAVRTWIAALESGSRAGSRYDLEHAAIGGRLIGRNLLPRRAVLSRYEQAWAVLGTAAAVADYRQVLELTADSPGVRSWVATQPHKALDVAGEWPRLLAAFDWLEAVRGSGRHLREITAPGVDTKFVERHRSVLAGLLAVPASGTGFLSALGLATRPDTLRLRPGAATAGFGGFSDLVVRVDELRLADIVAETAIVVENEASFLSVPVPERGIVFWGKGFEVDRTGSVPWLREVPVHYWGDLDSHGFAILDRLRAWLPQTRSFLMDRRTLLEHRERWVEEPSPTNAALRHLTGEEQELYEDLVTDRFSTRVRLEQERIDWPWVISRLPGVTP